jgi:hypothetical protein
LTWGKTHAQPAKVVRVRPDGDGVDGWATTTATTTAARVKDGDGGMPEDGAATNRLDCLAEHDEGQDDGNDGDDGNSSDGRVNEGSNGSDVVGRHDDEDAAAAAADDGDVDERDAGGDSEYRLEGLKVFCHMACYR